MYEVQHGDNITTYRILSDDKLREVMTFVQQTTSQLSESNNNVCN